MFLQFIVTVTISNGSHPLCIFYKLNWYAVVDKTDARVGIVIVVRSNEGRIVATMRRNQCLFPFPSLAEAYGALQAVGFALELGLSEVIF